MKYFIIKNAFFANRLRFLSLSALVMFFFTLVSCDSELDVKTDFPFVVEVMPVPKRVGKDGTVNIICSIQAEGNYNNTKYYLRYFQFDGDGKLILPPYKILNPNKVYQLQNRQFTIEYYSISPESQSFDIWIFDNKGHEQKLTFEFEPKDG